MTLIKAQQGKVFRRKHDGILFGNEIHLGMDYSTGVPRQDLPEYYEEIRDPEAPDPPTMSGNLVTIPEKFEWVFRNDRFELNGFVVELIRTPDKELCVDVAYLRWQAFQDELDKPENATVKQSLEPVWDYVLEIAIENEYI